jgi:mannose PTS system EIID component
VVVRTAAAVEHRPRRVSRTTLVRVFLRSLFLQAAWNPRGMQNIGFADAISPALAELYPDPAERARAVERHLEFFNCHPYLAARTLGPPFAALGDGFFWLALRPAAALAAAATVPVLGMGAVLVFLFLYNAVHLAARVWLFAVGYERAEGVVEAVARAHLSSGTPLLKACGAALAGALAARGILVAGLPDRPLHALLVAALIAVAWAALPRLGATRAVYIALVTGLALGAGFF